MTDNGVGIKEEYHQRIFELFRRVGKHTEPAGTGLGLAIARRVVERHGGVIGVDSTPGEGSTFHISLPGLVSPGTDRPDPEQPDRRRRAADSPAEDSNPTAHRSPGPTRAGVGQEPARQGEKALSHDR